MIHLGLLLSFAPLALAAEPAFFCRPAARIAEKVAFCESNDIYLQQARECRTALEQQVAQAGVQLKTALAARRSGDSQAGQLGTSAKDYAAGGITLAQLIVRAGLAAKDIDSYLDWIVFPEDADEPEIAGPDAAKYLAKVSCFGDNERGIKDELARVKKMQAELTAAGAATAALGAATTAGGASLQQNSATAPLPSAKAKPEPARTALPKGGVAKDPTQSDISGTEKVKK